MGINSKLNDALCDVRKAYRIIVAYQRRIIDMAKIIQNSFGYKYFYRVNHNYNATGTGSPTNRPSIDMLPLYTGLSMFFLPQESDPHSPKKNEWMLEVIFYNDTGFKNIYGQEPDITSFNDADKSESKLWLCAFGVIEDLNNMNWYDQVYQNTKWPEPGAHFVQEKFWAAGKFFNLAKIPDEPSLNFAIDDFKRFVADRRKAVGVL